MKDPSVAPAFATVYPVLAEAARSVGYALAIHGTLQRDLDVIAVPWTEDAKSEAELLAALCAATASKIHEGSEKQRPHGRRSIGLLLGCGGFLDLTVMQLTTQQEAENDLEAKSNI